MRSLSLKFRITALALLVAVIPLFIFNVISAIRSKDNMLEYAVNDMNTRSQIIAKSISRTLAQRFIDIKMISKADVLRTQNSAQIREYIKAVTYANDAIDDVNVVGLDGVIRLSSSDAKNEGHLAWEINRGTKELFLASKQAANDEVYTSEAHQEGSGAKIMLMTPVYDTAERRVLSILLLVTNIENVKTIISEPGEQDVRGKQTYIVDKLGHIISSNDDALPSFQTLPDIRLQPALLGDSHGTAFYEDANGMRVIAGFRDMPEFGVNDGLDWSVVTIAPVDEILRSTKETSRVLTSIGLIVTAITILVAYFFARSVIQPLRRAALFAEEIRRGNYSQRLDENMGGEIGSLAKAINEMADRVEERAAEITTRNEKLTSEIVERKIAQDRLQNLSHKIVRLQEEERRRVSRELHDGINQLLVSVKYKIENFEEKFNHSPQQALDDIKKAGIFLGEAIAEVRRVSHDLRPSVLDDLGLMPAISNLLRRFSERNLIDVEINGLEDNFERLPTDVETALYRIVQEALMNIEKHANATHVAINITRTDTNITIRIEDNGEGFSMQKAMRKTRATQSMGLRNMRERIELLQGTFFIHSDVGKGTFLEVKAPLNLDTPLSLEN
jgi:signal transduction histidine kinase